MSTVFCDRDGVVNVRRYCPEDPAKHYVLKWEDFEWLPGAKEACIRLIENGHYLIFVSNQSGIGKGLVTEGEVNVIFFQMMNEIWNESPVEKPKKSMRYIFCPHASDFGCECRKPKPGMFWKTMVDHELKHQDCWMIGDRPSDMNAGWNAGIRKLIKLPSLEEPESPIYSYPETAGNFRKNTAGGVLIDSLPHAVDFLLEWDSKHP